MDREQQTYKEKIINYFVRKSIQYSSAVLSSFGSEVSSQGSFAPKV